jgi:small ubiquitin-related modifier
MSNNGVKDENRRNEEAQFIKLKVVGQDGTEVHFRLNVKTPLGKMKRVYSGRLGLPAASFRFLFDGHRIADEETPKQLDMQDNDLVEVYQEQTGGGVF